MIGSAQLSNISFCILDSPWKASGGTKSDDGLKAITMNGSVECMSISLKADMEVGDSRAFVVYRRGWRWSRGGKWPQPYRSR